MLFDKMSTFTSFSNHAAILLALLQIPLLSSQNTSAWFKEWAKQLCYIAMTYKTVKTRRQLCWRKGKSGREDECVARAERQMVLATRIVWDP